MQESDDGDNEPNMECKWYDLHKFLMFRIVTDLKFELYRDPRICQILGHGPGGW